MKLLRSMTTIGAFTIGSRLMGFIREMLMASLLGAGAVSDAFIIALKLPSVFRRILAEGAMNAAFVPLFSGLLATKGEQKAKSFAEEILALLTLISLGLVVLAELFLPILMPLFVPGFKATPERMALAIEFSRLTFPFIFLISLTALYSGILNSYEKFAAVASSPMMGNIAVILTVYVLLWGTNTQAGYAFSIGILACGIVQLLWVIIPLARRGIVLSWVKPRWTSEVKRFFKLMAPAAAGSGVVQLSIFIDTLIASLLPAGGISYIHYADRLNQLPLSVLGTAVGTALLPLLSKKIRTGDIAGAEESQNLALEYTLLFTLPATLGLILLAEPLIKVTYEHHEFNSASTLPTARALMVLAAGLPAYVLIKIFTTSFFAREDTKTPVIIGILSVIANVLISLSLLKSLQHVGIALATAISAWMNAALSGIILWQRGAFQFNDRFRRFLPRVALSSFATSFWILALKKVSSEALESTFFSQFIALFVMVGGGIFGFFVLARLTGAFDLKDFQLQFRKDKNISGYDER
ncbi:MAG: murein biosynthesis integral membrane protein MurJ [Caedimonas sp.]|nr:murein biosynthesis integral membrane protein MurJ [Caedimonas sp.]